MHRVWPSPPHRSASLWPQVIILDFLDTFSSSSRPWCHHFLLYSSILLSDFRRGTCMVGRDECGRRMPPWAACAIVGGWWCFLCYFSVLSNVYISYPYSRVSSGPSRGLDNSCRHAVKRPRSTDTRTHDSDSQLPHLLLYWSF